MKRSGDMNFTLRTRTILIALIAGLLVTVATAHSSARMLGVAWERGFVTKAPWTETDGNRYIEVDDYTYTFVSPDVVLEKLVKSPSDSWYVEPLKLSEIWVGQEVLISVGAHHIYHLIIEVGR
jgi:hypothetical protein